MVSPHGLHELLIERSRKGMDQNWCYIGPTVARLGLKKTTITLTSEPPPQLKSLMELKPIIKALFVPTNKVFIARQNMEKRGTLENIAAEEVIKMAREKVLEERKVKTDKKG